MSAAHARQLRASAAAGPAPRSEVGSAAAEIVILTPLLIMVALLFVVGGRLANGLQEVATAARGSVESAVIAPTPSTAETQGAAAAAAELSHDCRSYSFAADVADFVPGGVVSVQVRCEIGLAALGIPMLPDSVVLVGRASGALEPYREAE
jgi:Flp pilus assembly protein TadG